MARFCTGCGAPRPEAARFCGQCGRAFPMDASAADLTPPVVMPPPVATPPVEPVPPLTPTAAASPVPASAMPGHGPAAPAKGQPSDEASFTVFPTPEDLGLSEPAPAIEPADGPTIVPDAASAVAPVALPDHPPSTGPDRPIYPTVTPPPLGPVAYDDHVLAPPPPPQPNRTPMLLIGLALAAVAVAAVAWWAFSDIQVNGIQPKAKGSDPVVAAPVDAGPVVADPAYVDNFLTTTDEVMATRGPVALLPQPMQSGVVPLRSLPEGAPITGRWVRGSDGVSRWFRVNGGGYLPEAAVVAAARPPARTRNFDFNAAFGSTLGGYVDQASAEHRRAMEIAAKKGEDELQVSGFARVPSRRLYGVTVAAVGSHYESTSIVFRENVTVVRAALRAAGWQVSDDGTLTVGADDPVSCSVIAPTQWSDFDDYGQTALICGV